MNSTSSHPFCENEENFYVYTLAYPDELVFYVGKGKGNRIDMHEWEAMRNYVVCPNMKKRMVIRDILSHNKQLVKKKLAYFKYEDNAYLYEYALIFFMMPYGNLVNIATRPGHPVIGKKKEKEKPRYERTFIKEGKQIVVNIADAEEVRSLLGIGKRMVRGLVDGRLPESNGWRLSQ